MIISKTPLRISFLGGNTDLPKFYRKEFGCVISTAIDKYVYLAIHPNFEPHIRIQYTKNEFVSSIEEIENTRVKAVLEKFKHENPEFNEHLVIHSIADVPAKTGLGSSSSFLISLLHALHAQQNKNVSISNRRLAEEAVEIELNILKEPIGKQDQYIASFGGLRYIQFNPDESVLIEPIICSSETKKTLENNLLMFYTGETRSASDILNKLNNHINNDTVFKDLIKLRDLTLRMKEKLSNNNLEDFGLLLDQGWKIKKNLSDNISNSFIDEIYEKAIKAGAQGGKLLGAGASGFLLFYCEEDRQDNVRKALSNLKEFQFKFESEGSRIIHMEN